ncbi:putative leucine-rich repeat receptor-like protein kinase At2g19210 [Cynara cardunculus var. scolymus]|uniref:putative leucine-rich repeat receptor-like protein kinase At2g19210 n=1 Tax=Cynara cardunculus var. scolymus TaxID=59895 RepID=UPI000D6270E6|nr:putative leucine-rich repeat receptor-like protein kinase At2g19210 [Cynara cardunculus var. scolymus]
MCQGFLPMLVFLGLILTSTLVHGQDDQSGFISIDCGIVEGSTYTDNVTGINYVSDTDFIDSGQIHNILPIYNSFTVDTQLTTLTSFPQNTRNCYTLKPTQGKGNRYLIRARFMYGNYDFNWQLPEFDVYLGPDYWDTMKFNSSSKPVSMEIIHVPSSDYIHVCLVNTGRGTPFISAIELRLLASNMYKETDFGSLYLFARVNFGSAFGTIRYKADEYDRLWSPINWPNSTFLYTLDKVSTGLFTTIDPPSEVMSTAITPRYPKDSFNIAWNPDNTTDKFFMYMHFAEIEILKQNQTREFNIYLNGNLSYGPFSPLNHTTTTIYSTEPEIVAPSYTLAINKTKNSTLPPIINALELYTLKHLPQRQTDDQDATAMWSIKSSYIIRKNWQGDPCAPQEFVWDGVRCSYNDTGSPRIVSLNLSTSGLNGEIDPGLANLTMMHTLDLSNNNLTGAVPSFLSGMNFLKVLNLKGNNFIGTIPAGLLAKANKGSLTLSFDGESTGDTLSSCGTNRCKRNRDSKIIVPVVATVASLFVILIALTAIWMIRKQMASGSGLEIRKQQYTYSEVQSFTDNFSVVIGKGGFGTVYHGYIDDTEVAVKMLSESSLQGDKEFQAEAYLLLSVHHKNLTSLVGYCNEGNHKAIIYEYMANGNLEKHLFDTGSSVLNWEERLLIGCDAAHGLEYLHHGCKPPIVHRDVKCTNILLNGTFQAKLADFGLSKAFPSEGGSHISTAVAGTPGYLDPEYYTSNWLTEKSDVYSFGVVLLVIITGQPAITKYDKDNMHISRWVNLMLADGNVKNIVDPRLLGDFDINSAWKAVELAMACVARTPSRRPTMNEVVMELNDCLVIERARQETQSKTLTGLMSLNLESTHDPNPR